MPIEYIHEEHAHPHTAPEVDKHVKIPHRVVPVELIAQTIDYKNKKHQKYKMFKKLPCVHIDILAPNWLFGKKKSAQIALVAESFLGLSLTYYHSLKLSGC